MDGVEDPRKLIDVVLPVYNEEEGIAAFNESLFSVLHSLEARYRFSVTYVVDRSRDRSFEILCELAQRYPEITVLHLSRRFGHQMSLVAGMDHSRGDALIMMDSDSQHPPELIPVLLEKLESGYDVVSTVRQYNKGVSLPKRLSSDLFYRVHNLLSPIEIPPSSADFRLLSRRVVQVFQSSIREQEQFLRGLVPWVGYRVATVPFSSPPRQRGTSKYGTFRLLQFSITGIVSFSKAPLRLATVLGLIMSSVSVLYGLELAVSYFLDPTRPSGYTSLAVLMLFLGGLQLLVLGVLGEYVASIYSETKHRPLYIVADVVRGTPP